MFFTEARNSDKMAAVHTDYTCSISILNCFYFLNMTLENLLEVARKRFFSVTN